MSKSFVNVNWDKVDKKVRLNKTNYTRLSVEAGLNRSYFHKARTGAIRCNGEYFKRLCNLLNLIPAYYILDYKSEETETIQDVIDSMDKKQKNAVCALVNAAANGENDVVTEKAVNEFGLTDTEQEKLDKLCDSSEEFRKALKHFTEDSEPIAIPDPIVTSAANRKWLRALETETNEILSLGILKDANAAVHYAYYKITHSYISNSIDKMEITPTSDGTMRVRFKEVK